MFPDKEQEIRRQFLDEAEEYLCVIESGLLGVGDQPLSHSQLDTLLRAAHSIKGGAAMMSYTSLSDLAHRLEDCFKCLQTGWICGNLATEQFFLKAVDCLRQCIDDYRQNNEEISSNWLELEVYPLFDQLKQQLGENNPSVSVSEENDDQQMRSLLFETEVEACLQRLENVVRNPDKPCLREEFSLAAQEFSELGQMLEIPAFVALCHEIEQAIITVDEDSLEKTAELALQQWRRSQALVILGNLMALPETLVTQSILSEKKDLEQETLDLLASVNDLSLDDVNLLEDFEEVGGDTAFLAQPQIVADQTDIIEEVSTKEKETTVKQYLRVSSTKIQELGDLFGELTIERNGLNLQLKQLQQLIQLLKSRVKVLDNANYSLRNLYDNSLTLPNSIDHPYSSGTKVRDNNLLSSSVSQTLDLLEMDRYSEIHPLFQNLMETIVQIQEVTGDIELNVDQTQRVAKDLTRTSGKMQTHLTQVRMRPFSDLVERFPRALREMSIKYGKEVNLSIEGESTLIDRTILDALSDPLIHLLRNAFDHGIEESQTRIAQGKPSQGNIHIAAVQRGNRMMITIQDDGKGIDIEKIRTIAATRSEIPLSDNQLLDLIFEPGFSTQQEVSELSGRGVGMNIVRTQLEQIRGQIQVSTQKNKGTTFTIIVPFTLSVVRVLLVENQGMLMAIPTNTVEEMLVIPTPQKIQSAGQEWLHWDGVMIPLISLRSWLNFNRLSPQPRTDEHPLINQPVVLIIAQGNRLFGLEMERYWGEMEVTLRTLDSGLSLPQGLTGCTILGDGRVVPLADPLSLIRSIEQSPSQTDMVESYDDYHSYVLTSSSPSRKSTIMIVDDSINVRRFLALTLEKAGYLVIQAKDGQEALEKLEQITVNAIICDIEMPRLDGYGFLAHLRADSRFQLLPVVMLTSRSGEKHRTIAMNLGANAYFSKPFQEHKLLNTLSSLIKEKHLFPEQFWMSE